MGMLYHNKTGACLCNFGEGFGEMFCYSENEEGDEFIRKGEGYCKFITHGLDRDLLLKNFHANNFLQ